LYVASKQGIAKVGDSGRIWFATISLGCVASVRKEELGRFMRERGLYTLSDEPEAWLARDEDRTWFWCEERVSEGAG